MNVVPISGELGVAGVGVLDRPDHVAAAHRGGDAAGVHRVDPDAVLAELRGERPGHADERVLAGRVVDHERLHLLAGVGAGQHDRSAVPAGDEVRGARHDGVPDTGDVDVDRVLEDLRRRLVPRRRDADAGVGHDDVEPPELAERPRPTNAFMPSRVTDVALVGQDPTTLRLDLLAPSAARSSGVAESYGTPSGRGRRGRGRGCRPPRGRAGPRGPAPARVPRR